MWKAQFGRSSNAFTFFGGTAFFLYGAFVLALRVACRCFFRDGDREEIPMIASDTLVFRLISLVAREGILAEDFFGGVALGRDGFCRPAVRGSAAFAGSLEGTTFQRLHFLHFALFALRHFIWWLVKYVLPSIALDALVTFIAAVMFQRDLLDAVTFYFLGFIWSTERRIPALAYFFGVAALVPYSFQNVAIQVAFRWFAYAQFFSFTSVLWALGLDIQPFDGLVAFIWTPEVFNGLIFSFFGRGRPGNRYDF